MGKLVAEDQRGSGISRRCDTPTPSHRLCLVNAQSKSFLIPEELGLMRGFGLSHCFQLQTGQWHPEVGSGREFETNTCQPRAGIPSTATTEPPESRTAPGLSRDAKGTWLHKPAPWFVPRRFFWEAGDKNSIWRALLHPSIPSAPGINRECNPAGLQSFLSYCLTSAGALCTT